jgi:hypothetical protein
MANVPFIDMTSFQTISLVYQLLYFKFADKPAARNIYRNKNLYSSEFYKFDLSKSQAEYLDVILPEVSPNSIYYYPKEKIEEVKKLKLDSYFYNMAETVFISVYQQVQKMKNRNDREFILSFITNFELFKKYTDLVSRKGIVMVAK